MTKRLTVEENLKRLHPADQLTFLAKSHTALEYLRENYATLKEKHAIHVEEMAKLQEERDEIHADMRKTASKASSFPFRVSIFHVVAIMAMYIIQDNPDGFWVFFVASFGAMWFLLSWAVYRNFTKNIDPTPLPVEPLEPWDYFRDHVLTAYADHLIKERSASCHN